MNVTGLNKLGFSPPARKASEEKIATEKGKSKSSFESVLADTKSPKSNLSSERPPDKESQKSDVKPEPKADAPKPVVTKEPKAPSTTTTKDAERVPEPVATSTSPSAPQAVGPIKGAAQQAEAANVNANVQPDAELAGESLDADSSALTVNSESLPGTTGGTLMSGPVLADRGINSPVNPNVVNLAKQAPSSPPEDPTNALTRRVVWNDFLRKMGDIGVSAEDVVKAFASLSEKELAQPPEQSVDKIVMALGLDGQQATMAKQYFTELVAKTKSSSLGDELNSSQKQLSLTMMSQRDLQRKTLQSSLENMDRNFFMNRMPVAKDALVQEMPEQGKAGPAPMFAAAPEAATQESSSTEASNALRVAPFAVPGLSTMAPQAAPSTAAAAAMSSAPSNEMSELVGQMEAPAGSDKRAIDDMVRNLNLRQVKGLASPNAASVLSGMVAAPTSGGAAVATPSGAAQAPLAALGLFAGGKGNSNDAGEDAGQQDSSGANTLGANGLGDNRLTGLNPSKGEFQAQMTQATGTQMPTTIPELMQQAHIMVREGGGDMKVTMHPEGLGEVAMRVSVTDGKVSIQMITESDEAKKLIERQIGELKSGLSANHLQVESIKIDTATNLKGQMEQQYNEASRQQAHANLEQFRQDHQGWRRSFFETGSANPYEGQGNAPRDIKAPNANAKNLSARRLDLVA